MTSPLSELRTILRILNKWPSTRPRDSIWKTYLRAEYRRSAADAASLEALRRRARDYANLLDGVEEQKRLRALDTGAEVSEGVKEAIRRSAARSGLVAPDDVDAPFVDLNKERNGEYCCVPCLTYIIHMQLLRHRLSYQLAIRVNNIPSLPCCAQRNTDAPLHPQLGGAPVLPLRAPW